MQLERSTCPGIEWQASVGKGVGETVAERNETGVAAATFNRLVDYRQGCCDDLSKLADLCHKGEDVGAREVQSLYFGFDSDKIVFGHGGSLLLHGEHGPDLWRTYHGTG